MSAGLHSDFREFSENCTYNYFINKLALYADGSGSRRKSSGNIFTGAQTPNLCHGPVTNMGKY